MNAVKKFFRAPFFLKANDLQSMQMFSKIAERCSELI